MQYIDTLKYLKLVHIIKSRRQYLSHQDAGSTHRCSLYQDIDSFFF